MSDLRKLADATEYLFKEVCKVNKSPHFHIDGVKSELGKALSQLARAAAEQEALSRAPQDIERAKRHIADMQEETWYDRKGSSVEYYKDRLVDAALKANPPGGQIFSTSFHNAATDYRCALSASPDPEGEWQWVPNTHVVAPKEATQEMIEAGYKSFNQYESYHYIDSIGYGSYPAMIAARPPVPKKEEWV